MWNIMSNLIKTLFQHGCQNKPVCQSRLDILFYDVYNMCISLLYIKSRNNPKT